VECCSDQSLEQAEAADAPPEPSDAASPPGKALIERSGGRGVEQLGPLHVLREALQAIKASGEPDWAIRLSAARTLATLRPQEFEPKTESEPARPEIVVHDLPPGSNPVPLTG
jgi:hypothetical protein